MGPHVAGDLKRVKSLRKKGKIEPHLYSFAHFAKHTWVTRPEVLKTCLGLEDSVKYFWLFQHYAEWLVIQKKHVIPQKQTTLPGNREKHDRDATDLTSFAEAVADGATSSFALFC